MTTNDLQSWVGRSKVEGDQITLAPVRGMTALLDGDPDSLQVGSVLPEGWHWFYFKPMVPQSAMGEDGHERRGLFLPPVSLPRRMWVGGRINFLRQILIGDAVELRSAIASVTEKDGRSGKLVFVTVKHVITTPSGPAVEEEQDIVYRDAPGPGEEVRTGPPPPPPNDADWTERFFPSTVALFRFSALTFNAHRIHYDHPYATEVEGYPAIVVHGPLTAMLLLDAARKHCEDRPARFEYRAVSPLFADREFVIGGRLRQNVTSVWAASSEGGRGMGGGIAMEATVDWAS